MDCNDHRIMTLMLRPGGLLLVTVGGFGLPRLGGELRARQCRGLRRGLRVRPHSQLHLAKEVARARAGAM